MRVFKAAIRIATALMLLAVLGGYLGALHPLGDSLAVFRLWFAGVALFGVVLLAFLRDRILAGLTLVIAAVSMTPVLINTRIQATETVAGDISVYVKNLGSARADTLGLFQDIEESGADVLLLQEVTRDNARILQERLTTHPYWHVCQSSGWNGVVMASRWPLTETACTSRRSVAAAMVQAPGGPIWAASVHQVWPYPYDQAVLLPMVLDLLDVEAERQVVAGDFNMVPWAHSVSAITRVSGTTRIGPVQTTFRTRSLGLPIDHVLTTGQGSVERRPQFGSRHFGLLARIAFGR